MVEDASDNAIALHSAFARAAISAYDAIIGLYTEPFPCKMSLWHIMRKRAVASYADWIPHNH